MKEYTRRRLERLLSLRDLLFTEIAEEVGVGKFEAQEKYEKFVELILKEIKGVELEHSVAGK